MSETGTAKRFKHGRSQAVRLPKAFRLPGQAVRVRRVGRAVLLEPIERDIKDIEAIFAEIDRLTGGQFLPEGRPEEGLAAVTHLSRRAARPRTPVPARQN